MLAVFVMVTALAMPSVSRTFAGQQLRSAADIVRARFAEARVKAIETGDVYGFFYTPGENQHFLAPMVQGFQSIRDGRNPNTAPEVLENEIIFAAGEALEDARSVDATQQATQEFSNMRPVLFYPDGTSQDAVVILQSSRTEAMIQVELRGLTGTSARSRILDPAEVRQ